MINLVKNFKNDESGAVTVDWVVLTAAVVALAIGILTTVDTATSGLSNKISNAIGNQTIEE